MQLLVTGATGFIGQQLMASLQASGHSVKVLSRDAAHATRILGVPAYGWDYRHESIPDEALSEVDGIVHLMGENLGRGRWTARRKREIYDSRIISTRKLVAAAPAGLQCFVCASAIGIYPGKGDDWYDESYVIPDDCSFMQTICRDWEQEAAAIERKGVRRVSIRTGVVLGKEGGILGKLLPLFRMGLGGSIGDGRQWLPWIHIDDIVSIWHNAVCNQAYSGPINAVAPNPVRYLEFARTLGTVLHRPALLTTPAALLRLILGEAAALALNSYRISSQKLRGTYDFSFKFDTLSTALENLLEKH